MANELIWTKIHDEREALLSDLEQLTDAQWSTQSLCSEWTVQQVVAHLTGTAASTKFGFVKDLISHRGNIDALTNRDIAEYAGGSSARTLAAFRETLHNHTAPPGPLMTWLGEVVLHAEDIRRPLGLTREYPAETLRTLGDFYKSSPLGMGARKRIKGLQLMATDQEWSHGEGDVVEGPMIALLMTMTGREAFLNDLSGSGLEAYRARVSATKGA